MKMNIIPKSVSTYSAITWQLPEVSLEKLRVIKEETGVSVNKIVQTLINNHLDAQSKETI